MKNLDSTQMSKRKGIIQSPQYCPPPSIQKRFFFFLKKNTYFYMGDWYFSNIVKKYVMYNKY